jgi:hypothetical protein
VQKDGLLGSLQSATCAWVGEVHMGRAKEWLAIPHASQTPLLSRQLQGNTSQSAEHRPHDSYMPPSVANQAAAPWYSREQLLAP